MRKLWRPIRKGVVESALLLAVAGFAGVVPAHAQASPTRDKAAAKMLPAQPSPREAAICYQNYIAVGRLSGGGGTISSRVHSLRRQFEGDPALFASVPTVPDVVLVAALDGCERAFRRTPI
jgi:hypothetical protein